MKRIAVWLACCWVAVSCGYDRFDPLSADDLPEVTALPNADLATLRAYGQETAQTVAEDLVVEGYVTSDDRTGNFYLSFFIEDATGAAEIRAGMYDLFRYVPRGRRVVLHLKGLAIGRYDGVVQIGAYADGDRVAEFGARAILDGCLERDVRFRHETPLRQRIALLDETMCGRLVRIGPVRRTAESPERWAQPETDTEAPQSGTVAFRDGAGDTVRVVTSGYADFAGGLVPSDSVTLTGILLHGPFDGSRTCFALELRDEEDVE